MATTVFEKKLAKVPVAVTKEYAERFATPFPDVIIAPEEMDAGFQATFSNGERTGLGQSLAPGNVSLVPVFVPARCRVTGINVMNVAAGVDDLTLEAAVYRHDGKSPLPAEKVTNSYFIGKLPDADVTLLQNQVLRFADEGNELDVWNNFVKFRPFVLERGMFWVAVLNRGAAAWEARGASNTHGVTLFNMFLHSGAWTATPRGLFTSVAEPYQLPAVMKEGRRLRPTFTGVANNLLRLRSSVISVELSYEL
jgi:hypothetical protein